MLRRAGLAGLILFFNLLPPSAFAAESSESLISRMEKARGFWTALQAESRMVFRTSNAEGSTAVSCSLNYQRLEERLLLVCRSEKSGREVFRMATDDRTFQLFLPAKATLYSGDMLHLEFSPDIESHLRPLDLIRSLKSGLPHPDDLRIARASKDVIHAEERNHLTGTLKREIKVGSSGEILKEIYVGPDGEDSTLIRRSDFRSVPGGLSRFPHKILIQHRDPASAELRETLLFLSGIIFSEVMEDEALALQIPDGTRKEMITAG